MARRTKRASKKAAKLSAKKLNPVKSLKTPSPAGPVPIPYPN